jgi:hypothetical protein
MSHRSSAVSTGAETERRNNRLLGWLVSYGLDAQGASFEIRAGRSLLTTRPLGDSREIVVAEESISAPHAALNAVSRDDIVLIQDIFSDYGTFITRSGEREENPVEGAVVLHHGDWIRFGETVRFQVCLIDGGR